MAIRTSEFVLCTQMAKSSRKYWTEAEHGIWQLEVSAQTELLHSADISS